MQRTQYDDVIVRVSREPVDYGPGVQASSGVIHYHSHTAIPEAWIADRRLSADAGGLLMYIAMHRDHELPTFADLASGVDGPVKTRRALDELDRVGYLISYPDGRYGIRDARLRVVA